MTIAMSGEASIYIDAPPEKVYSLVSDVTRVGEWSPECRSAEWAEGVSTPSVGAQFHGRNERGGSQWTTPNTILVADEGREFAWVVGTSDFRVCTWRYRLDPEGEGTRLTESFELGKEPVGFAATVLERPPEERQSLVEARRRQLVDDMQQTLASIKEMAEGG